MAKKGVTRWHLTCPGCGGQWTVDGRGKWLARIYPPWDWDGEYERYDADGEPIPGPWSWERPSAPAEPGARITHHVHRAVPCVRCIVRGDALTPADDLMFLEREIAQHKRARPYSSGEKDCARCHKPFLPTRSDACYCSAACKKAMHRRMERLRSGRRVSEAMTAHDIGYRMGDYSRWGVS